MNNNIYDQAKERDTKENNSRKEIEYFLEDETLAREKRLKQSQQNRMGTNEVSEISKVKEYKTINKSNQQTKKARSKERIDCAKKVTLTVGAIGVMVAGSNVIIGEIKDYHEQKRIDAAMTDDYNAFVQNLSEKDNTILPSKKELNKVQEFYAAIEEYENATSLTQQVEAKSKIISCMESGTFQNVAQATIERKLQQAALYGDYKKVDREPIKVLYIEGTKGEADMLRLKGIDAKYYSMKKFDIWSEDIPDNLKQLSKDIFELQDIKSWNINEEDKCVEVAIRMSEDLGKVMQEYYTLDNDADIKRVSETDFQKAKEKYEAKTKKEKEKTRQDIYDKYGVVAKSNTQRNDNIEMEK